VSNTLSSKSFARTARALDIDSIRLKLSALCKTDAGATLSRELTPTDTKDNAIDLLDITDETIAIVKSGFALIPDFIEDPLPLIKKCLNGRLPEEKDIRLLLAFFSQISHLASFLSSPPSSVNKLLEVLNPFKELDDLGLFLMKTFDNAGKVKTDATAKLVELEGRINSLKKGIGRKAEALIERDDIKKILRDSYITIRNDRIVIPVRAEFKNVFSGIIHNISATEQTAFMEPQELVNENNRLQESISEREEEIMRLLRKTAELILANKKGIKTDWQIIASLDFISAKALLSIEMKGNRITFADGGEIDIKNLLHPIMVMAGEKPKANDIIMAQGERAFIISGPNAGGKTVLLKSLGLSIILSSCGIFPTLGIDSSIPFIKNVFAIAGDEQSIEEGQSTFSAQLTGIKESLEEAGEGDLIIIDEILNGTDPLQASALAQTVIDEFSNKECFTFVSTHLPELKIVAQEDNLMVNGAMGFDEDGKPSFKLEKGHPGVSYPLAIAIAVGIPQKLIDKAKEKLSTSHDQYHTALMELQTKSGKMDRAITGYESRQKEIENIKEELAVKLEEAERENRLFEKEKNKRIKEEIAVARKKVSEMTKEAEAKGKGGREKISAELKEMENRLTKEMIQPDSIPLEEVEEGGAVWIIPFDREAVLVKLGKDEKAEVLSSGVKMTMLKSNLTGIRKSKQKQKSKKRYKPDTSGEAPIAELSLLGFTFDESIIQLEPFMDRHILHGTSEIRVIHGKGVLKGKVEAYLKTSKYVESFRTASPLQGGAGASVVTLV